MQQHATTSVSQCIQHGVVTELLLKRPPGFNFVPGQCIDLVDDEGNARPYSIASGIEQDCIQLLIKQIPNGKVSNWVKTLKSGTSVHISKEPWGFFTPGQTDLPFTFISTGTGCAPFLSYIKSMRALKVKKPKRVIHGTRYFNELVDHTELTGFANGGKWNSKICVTREDLIDLDHEVLFDGRVDQFLQTIPIRKKHAYYLCGLNAMLTQVTDYLADKGVPMDNVFTENFYSSVGVQ